ncbi:MAG: hypothetical protein ACRCXZ_10995 [Patescibacteria group bacterium]
MFLIKTLKEIIKSKKTKSMNSSQLYDLQLSKFRNLVEFAYQNSKYYKKLIDTNKINIETCLPENFPVLDKKIVLDNFDDILTTNKISKRMVLDFLDNSNDYSNKLLDEFNVIRTSGSSGEIGIYVYTDEEMIPVAIAANRASGSNFLQRLAYIAKVDGHYAGVKIASVAQKLPLVYSKVEMINVNEDITTIVNKLNQLKPTVLSGYAFLISRLAVEQAKGNLKIAPKFIQVGGEPLMEKSRLEIKSVFQSAKLLNYYACSEMLVIGVGEAGENIEMMDDYVIVEKNANSIYATNLFNYTLPLIRFEIKDNIEVVKKTSYTNPFTNIRSLVGRVELNPLFVNDDGVEDFISGIIFTIIPFEGANGFQMVVKSKNEFEILVELGSNGNFELFKSTFEPTLQDILQKKKMTKLDFKYRIVDRIESDPKTGKFKAIVIQ